MRLALLVVCASLAGCRRGCASSPPEPASGPAPVTRPFILPPRCLPEITRASVVEPLGTGRIDTLNAACARGSLVAYALRSHTLSRLERPTDAGAGFSPPLLVSTGVDRLGPIASDAIDGPLAWRSPVAGIDADERDDVWAASITRDDAGALEVLRGDALMPAGVAGIGVSVPVSREGRTVSLLATIGREGSPPASVRVRVTLGREAPASVSDLASELSGELKAWEPSRRVVLARTGGGADGASLEATWLDATMRSRHRTESRLTLVVSRGVRVGDRSFFAVGEFLLGRTETAACLTVGEGLCVRPGALYLLVAGEPGAPLERVEVAPQGLPDSIAAQGDTLTVIYLGARETATRELVPEQRVARVQWPSREVTPLALEPPDDFADIDRPSLVACDDGIWVVTEVSLARRDAAPLSAVTALPLECIAH